MGNLIPFSNQRQWFSNDKNLFMINEMQNSPIRGGIRVLDDETHALMRVLHDERKVVKASLREASVNRNNQESEYWNVILKTFNSILSKFKQILPVQDVIEDLTLAEMDCLIGVVEEYIHERSLQELQLIEDSTPLVTKALLGFYESALPVYEAKRFEFEGQQKNGD